MDVTSLGFQTDLVIRRLAGAVIVDRREYQVVRTPANPGFWWGNFLLFPAPPRPGDIADWVAAFTAEFPGAGHLAFGVDGTRGERGDPAELAGFGLAAQVSTVLTAPRLREPAQPAQPAPDAVFRPLASDDDWAQAAELGLACDHHRDDPDHRLFAERKLTVLGGRTLVIVADPGDVAIRIYRSLGFAGAERQVQLMREPTTHHARHVLPQETT